MSIDDRSLMYEYVNTDINGNEVDASISIHQIPDFLDTKLIDMRLETIENFRIGDVFENRPDLISYKYFGNYHFGWLIAYHNDFLDMTQDFYFGRNIEIPDLGSYFKYFNRFSRAD